MFICWYNFLYYRAVGLMPFFLHSIPVLLYQWYIRLHTIHLRSMKHKTARFILFFSTKPSVSKRNNLLRHHRKPAPTESNWKEVLGRQKRPKTDPNDSRARGHCAGHVQGTVCVIYRDNSGRTRPAVMESPAVLLLARTEGTYFLIHIRCSVGHLSKLRTHFWYEEGLIPRDKIAETAVAAAEISNFQ